ncbi:5-(carboxyamino)imidazole ribonucleotide synthase [Sporichthya brevicatena]|uniref:N5-carboxyaminoimidazole ribonucleotide synthase n=1 Tax=Sporichthya brevicatena TaxID=171442 RepID=A0ABP3R799_9ACTN
MSRPVVGMVGGGQLARMTAQAAIALDVRLRVLAASPEESAAQIAADVVIGDHDDLDTLRAFAAGCDVITFDHEHVPTDHLRALEADGVAVRPGADALVHAQDKLAMRERLTGIGVPCPDWALVTTAGELAEFGDRIGWPVVVKTPRGGYDGRGVRVVATAAEAADWLERGPLLAEARVDYTRELAVQVARSPHGQAAVYPVVETVQRNGICREVLAPAAIDEDHALAAQRAALAIAAELKTVGMLAVEMFDTPAGVLVNELAMRPHNSGHWTIEGATTSQFEQHLRAVLDLPLGEVAMTAPAAVMANVLGSDDPERFGDLYGGYLHCLAHDPGLHIHNYGKTVVPGRKVGHVTVTGADPDDLLERARHAAAFLRGEIDG